MKLPNVLGATLILVLLFALQWGLSHVGEFGIPPLYLSLAAGVLSIVIAAVAKYAQERGVVLPETTTRGMVGAQRDSLIARVMYN